MISGHPDLRKSSLNLNYPRNSKLFNQKRVNHIAPGTSPSTRWRGNWRVISLYLPCQIFIGALFENSPCKVIFTDFSVLHIFYFLRLQLFIPKGLAQTLFLSHILYNKVLQKKKKGTISYSSQILYHLIWGFTVPPSLKWVYSSTFWSVMVSFLALSNKRWW